MRGLIHIYTGDGKGKTTAAVGLAIRAVGNGLKVFFVKFIKESFTSELLNFSAFQDSIHIYRCSTGFINGKPTYEQIKKIKHCLKELEEIIISYDYDIIVFDELIVALRLGLLCREELERLLKLNKEKTEIVITGRGAPEWLIDMADLVTEMRKIKHYFDLGITARRGIEY